MSLTIRTAITNDKDVPLDIAFGATKKIRNELWINENKRIAAIPKVNLVGSITRLNLFRYEDILDFELIQDGSSIINKGGLGRAVVGGLLFGGSGAVVGSLTGSRKQTNTCTELRIKITLNSTENPYVSIDYIKGTALKKNSIVYQQYISNAEEIMSLLQVISKDNDVKVDTAGNSVEAVHSNADEIRKYKSLFDDGIITQNEFEAKKKQLLGL